MAVHIYVPFPRMAWDTTEEIREGCRTIQSFCAHPHLRMSCAPKCFIKGSPRVLHLKTKTCVGN